MSNAARLSLWLHPRVNLDEVKVALARANLSLNETLFPDVFVITPRVPAPQIPDELPALLRPQAE